MVCVSLLAGAATSPSRHSTIFGIIRPAFGTSLSVLGASRRSTEPSLCAAVDLSVRHVVWYSVELKYRSVEDFWKAVITSGILRKVELMFVLTSVMWLLSSNGYRTFSLDMLM